MQKTNQIDIVYTPEAAKQLPKHEAMLQKKIEKFVKDDKYVFGDEVVEITAADLQRAFNHVQIINEFESGERKERTRKLVTYLYLVAGTLLTLFGALFPIIESLIRSQPQRAAIILSGIAMMLVGALFNALVSSRNERDNEKREILKHIMIENHSTHSEPKDGQK